MLDRSDHQLSKESAHVPRKDTTMDSRSAEYPTYAKPSVLLSLTTVTLERWGTLAHTFPHCHVSRFVGQYAACAYPRISALQVVFQVVLLGRRCCAPVDATPAQSKRNAIRVHLVIWGAFRRRCDEKNGDHGTMGARNGQNYSR